VRPPKGLLICLKKLAFSVLVSTVSILEGRGPCTRAAGMCVSTCVVAVRSQLRGLRRAAVRVGRQVRLWHRLAVVHGGAAGRGGPAARPQHPLPPAHRGARGGRPARPRAHKGADQAVSPSIPRAEACAGRRGGVWCWMPGKERGWGGGGGHLLPDPSVSPSSRAPRRARGAPSGRALTRGRWCLVPA